MGRKDVDVALLRRAEAGYPVPDIDRPKQQIPVPIPKVRPRALSLPLSTTHVESPPPPDRRPPRLKFWKKSSHAPAPSDPLLQTTSDQHNCHLFKLPLELRRDIYDYVFNAGSTVHLIHSEGRLARVPCFEAGNEAIRSFYHRCWC